MRTCLLSYPTAWQSWRQSELAQQAPWVQQDVAFDSTCYVKAKATKKVCQPSQSYILSSANRMRLPPSIIYSREVLRSEPFHRKSFLWYLQRLFVQLEFLARFPG